jgi:hypothetical protein
MIRDEIVVSRQDINLAAEKLLGPSFDWGDATPEQVKEAAFRWLEDEIDAMLAEIDWYVNREPAGFDEQLRKVQAGK